VKDAVPVESAGLVIGPRIIFITWLADETAAVKPSYTLIILLVVSTEHVIVYFTLLYCTWQVVRLLGTVTDDG